MIMFMTYIFMENKLQKSDLDETVVKSLSS